jgi:outer membrane lipoprotein-sorting protein
MKKIALFIFLFAAMTIAQDADKLLEKVQTRFDGIKDFSAEISQEGSNQIFNGRFYYKKTDQFRLELKDMIIVSDGSTIWNYNKKENRTLIDEVRNDASFPFSFEKILSEYPSKSNVSSSKDGNLQVLTFVPKPGSDLNFSKARLWINTENLIERISVENENQGSVTLRISGYKLNQNPSASLFVFEAPGGSRIIDLR